MSNNSASTTLSTSYEQTKTKHIGKNKRNTINEQNVLLSTHCLIQLHKRIKIRNSPSTSHTLRTYISGAKYYKSITSNYKEKKKRNKENKEDGTNIFNVVT